MNSNSDNLISASLSTQSLTYRPNKPEVSFEVTVNNDSDRFANFQLEIIAAGEIRNPNYRWYRLEPEVAAAQPHGSSTKFQVFIFNTPIPGFVGTVNLSVKIFSPQLGRERRLLLRLEIERDNKPILISVELPIRAFQVYPGNAIDIPVRVRNQGQVASNVLLRFIGIDASWVTNSAERRLTLNAGSQTEVSFRCEPPSVVQAPSLNYLFTVEATSNNSYPANAEGNLEVLPVGYINFSTPQNKQRIPSRRPWLPDWKSNSASYELLFKNVSNLRQEINVQIQGRDWRKCTFKKFPEIANLSLGETAKVILDVKTKRPWVGIGKTLLLEAKAELSDQRLGSTDPATQSLELEVLPIIPLWLQLAILALLAALLALLFRQEAIAHTGFVNSVRISGTGTAVVSASDDCTLRFWRIRTNSLEPDETGGQTSQQQLLACGKPQKGRGLLAVTNDKNRVVQFVPVQNDRVAVGLDSGVIQLRQVPTGKQIVELQDPEAPADRVFDLAFTTNSLNLYSGSGKGKVRLWSRASIDKEFQKQPNIDLENLQKLPNFPIRALALSPDDTILIISGNFNRFLILPLNKNLSNTPFKKLSLQKVGNIDGRGGANDFIFGLAFIPNSKEKILATSDSAGFIVIWDLNKCKVTSNAEQQIDDLNCTPLDRWQIESKNAVRALAFSEDGSLLVSGGDDGRVVTWNLSSDHKIDRTNSSTGKAIYQSSKKINSVDLKSKQGIVISGSEDFQVELHRIK
jgi:WD40 repeat protein